MRSFVAVVGTVLLLGLAVGVNLARQSSGLSSGGRGTSSSGGTSHESSVWSSPTQAAAHVLTSSNWNSLVKDGKESDAIYGDFVLKNSRIHAVIAQPLATRNANMTVRDAAGALIDFTSSVSTDDQLAAFFPGKKQFAYRSVMFRDGSGKEVAPTAEGIVSQAASIVVKAEATETLPEVSVTYSLRAADPYLTVTSTFTNRSSKPLTVSLEDDFRADGGREEMVRSPNATTDRFWLYDRYWGQAYGLDAAGLKMQLNSDPRVTAIKYETPSGQSNVTLEPGQSHQLVRHLYSSSDVFRIHQLSQLNIKQKQDFADVTIGCQDLKGSRNNYWLEFMKGDDVVGSLRLQQTDSFRIPLIPGDYGIRLYYCGNSTGTISQLTVPASGASVTLQSHLKTGVVQGRVLDEHGERIPCKVELKPLTPDAKLDFGPESAEFAVRNLIYTPDGRFERDLPAGKYSVTVSRGPEFDAIFSEIDVVADQTATISGKLIRTVNTSGWISTDYHSHSTPSGDNTSSQLGRVLNLVAENIEFAPCTEHNRISTYQPHIERLGVGQFISSVSGIEMTGTPLVLNHQNAFPMQMKPRTQDNGAPITDPDLETQIERLALANNRSEKLLQVNHPDLGWMFYDKNGDGQPDGGHERAFPFMDVVEIHPIDDALKLEPVAVRGTQPFHNTVFRWIQLLNQGFRIYGVVNTDAHYNYHGSGWLRNWVQSTTDDPANIDHMEMVHASEQGRIVMSNGPYLEVTASESGQTSTVVPGQDLKANGGKVAVKVKVQCPNWLDIDTVTLLVNGRKHAVHNYTKEKNPDLFRGGFVKFDKGLDLNLTSDAHVIVIAGDVEGNMKKIYGDTYGAAQPTAISNPIFIDVDGNGFQPNKDTLDSPLPVKFAPAK